MEKKLKIGVTGASGFIGKLLVNKLIASDYNVYVLTRDPSKINPSSKLHIIKGDLINFDKAIAIQNFINNIDVLYHIAGELKNEQTMQRINVDATSFLAKMCAQNNIHLVFLSSIGIFDFQNDINITEKSIPNPRNNYEISKFNAENNIKRIKNLNYTIIRPSIVLGLGMKSSIIKLLSRLNSLPFKIAFKKDIIANFILIEDLLKLLIVVKNNNACFKQEFNFSNDIPLISFINLLNSKTKRIIIPSSLFLLGLRLLFKIRLLPISKEGVLFFNNRTQIDIQKVKTKLKIKPENDYSKFLKKYLGE